MDNPLGLSKTKLNEILAISRFYIIKAVLGDYAIWVTKKTLERMMKAEVRSYMKTKRYGRRQERLDYRVAKSESEADWTFF
jgi:hypothetical protein